MASRELIQAIAVTAELCGRTFSPEAASVFVSDLAPYPEHQVLKALVRCRKEVRGVLTLQDVISRLDDGRPGAEEAWAMLPKSESESAVWSAEMSQAFGVASGLLDAGEVVAARMAFKETYTRMVAQARDAGEPVAWQVSLGHDPRGREPVLLAAVEAKRISLAAARSHCPTLPAPSASILALVGGALAA